MIFRIRQHWCPFARQRDGRNLCQQCGFIDRGMSDPERTFRVCPAGEQRWYDIVPLGLNFALAWAWHLLNGSPVTTAHVREQRKAICLGCRHFTGTRCRKCLCPIKAASAAEYFDKLGWADQSCPIGKWGAVRLPKSPLDRFSWWRRRPAEWLAYLSPYEPKEC